MIATDSRFRIADEVIDRTVDDEIVIVHLKQGAYFGLDPVGARVWTLMRSGEAFAGICAAIHSEFDADADQIEHDLRALADDLLARGLIHLA